MIINLPEEIEAYRDRKWRRDETLKVETAQDVERMIEELGFCLTLTDSRTPLPSVYIAVCGRRDAHAPVNAQKDYEMSLAWTLKDEVMARGRVYYGKLSKARQMFVAPRMIPFFNVVWGIPREKEEKVLSATAQKVLEVLREEWEMGTADLRRATKIESRARLTKAMGKLQRMMKIIPQEVLYQPRFTYIWTVPEARFPEEFSMEIDRKTAVREIARAFLEMNGMTLRGDLARALGITRKEAGRGNQALVKEGFADRLALGIYRLKSLDK